MRQEPNERLMLAGILTIAASSAGFADALCCYWVAGNRATSKCDIVASNPVVGGDGNVWFGDGPYKTLEMPSSRVQPFVPVRRTSPPIKDDGWLTGL
jgi:hypothetical protein